jgi:hypothetical protein
MGLLFVAAGTAIVLAGMGIIPVKAADDVRDSPWVIVCTGLMFVFGGAALVVGWAVAGGTGPNGDLRPDTPFSVRVVQYLLGLGIAGMMTAVCTWIAVGPGQRHFSMVVALPFIAWRPASNETVGRFAFGVAAALLWVAFIGLGMAGAQSLIRARSSRPVTARKPS